jgi:hypothetical protein
MPRFIRYLWALPTTMVGLLFLPLVLLGGGRAAVVDGVLEIHGRWIAFFLTRCVLIKGGASAMTLGHVVIGRDQPSLDRSRAHERVHVRQCERWGPLFIPAYLLSSLLLMLRGRDAYLENPFEREAYAADAK